MKLGCTAPFGININNICTEKNKSIEAMKLYKNLWNKQFIIKECPYPCTFTKTYFRGKGDTDETGILVLQFNKFIETKKSRYAYRELELLAEFGGYVGLFLGISVFNLSEVFDKILQLILPQD